MEDLLKKEALSEEELRKLDYYYDRDKIEELLKFDNEIIITFIKKCEEVLGYSLCKLELDYYLSMETSDAKICFDIEKLDYYNKILELINRLSLFDCGLAYSIGDYFVETNNKEQALKYYKNVFKKGFDLCNSNYFDSLVKYLKLLNKKPIEELKELIANSPRDGKYSLDFIDTYLLLIINLEKFSDEYLIYINEALKVALPVVRKYQSSNKGRKFFSDTDEERDLCELVALKLEYYVEKKDYLKAYEMYKELTYEIGRSDCTRYYHARDKYYRDMLRYMSNEYPELKFFEDIGYYKFKVLGSDKQFKVDQEIMLEKEDGLTFKFKVVRTYDNDEVVIAPILPLLGEGGFILTEVIVENECVYLQNRFSN